MKRWLGVDVGAERKGFDAAVVDPARLVRLERGLSVAEVVALAADVAPVLAALDGPIACAPDGERSRAGERALARAVCGIRWTPDAAAVRAGGGYYGWVRHGLALHAALAATGHEVIEVFPTASWTRWHGPRGGEPRSSWSRAALAGRGLAGVPGRLSQDARDAIGAALTARAHSAGATEAFGGEIVVPRAHGAGPAG